MVLKGVKLTVIEFGGWNLGIFRFKVIMGEWPKFFPKVKKEGFLNFQLKRSN